MSENDLLNEACRDLLDAAKRLQRITGSRVNLDLHGLEDEHFFTAEFLGSEFSNEHGDPRYGHVKGQKNGYLSRLIYRGDGVLFQFFTSVSVREKATV